MAVALIIFEYFCIIRLFILYLISNIFNFDLFILFIIKFFMHKYLYIVRMKKNILIININNGKFLFVINLINIV